MIDVAGTRVAVLGLGTSGVAAARVLAEEGATVIVSERRPREEVDAAATELESLGAEIRTGGHEPAHLDGVSLVVASPGIPESAEVLRWARDRDVRVWSELELGARLVSVPYVAVTGTNGKTTTTEMIAASMRDAGLDAVACGNVGHPFSLAARESHDALVVEASSFQLRLQESLHPRVSVLLNIAPDHLDWHPSVEAYAEAKSAIYAGQGAGDTHVGNRDDPAGAEVSRRAPCPTTWCTLEEPGDGETGYREGELVCRIGGDHPLGRPFVSAPGHLINAAAAVAASVSFGLPVDIVGRAVTAFAPLPHRGEVVADVAGIRFVDDSKATNPHAALATIRGYPGAVLIAGGRSKGIDLSPLAEAAPGLAAVVVLGEAADELDALFRSLLPVRRAASIEDAVQRAFELSSPGRAVVLAPACSSWDMFRDYRERGERFGAAARALGKGSRD